MVMDEQVRYSLLNNASDDHHCSYLEERDSTPDPLHIVPQRKRCRCCKPPLGLCILVVTSLALVLTIIAVYVYSHNQQNVPNTEATLSRSSDPSEFSDWEIELDVGGSESPLRLFDVNEDGILDLILGLTYNDVLFPPHCQQCKAKGCAGGVIAFDGRNGDTLWRIHTSNEVFELLCPAIDVDKDGAVDCLASGRHGTLLAFNPRSAEVIWFAPHYINSNWSVFAAAFVNDLDADGVDDMVIINGGDSRYAAEEHNRTVNHLVILSTRTGEMIGDRVFPMPDKKESYSLPAVYALDDGSQYIVFGTGGETVSGSLCLISLKDLLRFVGPDREYNLTGRYDHWTNVNLHSDSAGVLTLYRTERKGLMVPVTFADIDNDGDDDILAMTFDGFLFALSGKDLSFLWKPVSFTIGNTSTESYTSPTLGYFNDDDTLDIMVSWQTGSWPAYDSLMVSIVSGVDGGLLWFKDTPSTNDYTISPALTLSTIERYRDAFIYRLSSTNQQFTHNHSNEEVKKRSSADEDRTSRRLDLRKRHIAAPSQGQSCEDLEDVYIDTFIMDRTNTDAPLKLYTQHSQPYRYKVTMDMLTHYHHNHNKKGNKTSSAHLVGGRKRRHGDEEAEEEEEGEEEGERRFDNLLGTELCVKYNLRDVSAGVLADIDADGFLDYVSVDVAFAVPALPGSETSFGSVLKTTIRKFSLEKVLPLLPTVVLDEVTSALTPSHTEMSLSNVTLANITAQRWPQHLGRYQNGVY